ncbi:MAG: hypothetical protein DME76_19605 [Verrucomicrobia bacterium]|nr:MAG: hypothetical protein DME76_19605 [Verrucomicrobiota bacterium]
MLRFPSGSVELELDSVTRDTATAIPATMDILMAITEVIRTGITEATTTPVHPTTGIMGTECTATTGIITIITIKLG